MSALTRQEAKGRVLKSMKDIEIAQRLIEKAANQLYRVTGVHQDNLKLWDLHDAVKLRWQSLRGKLSDEIEIDLDPTTSERFESDARQIAHGDIA